MTAALRDFTNYLKTGILNHSLENYSDQNNEY